MAKTKKTELANLLLTMAIALSHNYPLLFANIEAESPSSPSAAGIDAGPCRNDSELRQNGQQTPPPLVKGAKLPT